MEYKKRLGEKVEEKKGPLSRNSKKLRRKYKIHEDGTILGQKRSV